MFKGQVLWRGIVYACLMVLGKLLCGLWLVRFADTDRTQLRAATKKQNKNVAERAPSLAPSKPRLRSLPKPKSLYPASILGSAMVARGEIGFLVSSIAQSKGIFERQHAGSEADGGSSDLFLIVTWAIMLCTIFGPVAVGLIVQRVKRLQGQRHGTTEGQADPLGIWGIDLYAASNT